MSPTTWTRSMVERRLVEAQQVVNAIVSVPSGRGRAQGTPVHLERYGEAQLAEWMRDRWDWLKHEGYVDAQTGHLQKPVPWRWPLEAAQPQKAIDRATEAMSWPILHIGASDNRARIAVLCWMVHKARGRNRHGYTQLVNDRLKLLFLSPVEKYMAHRFKDKGLRMIADGLNRAQTLVREAA